MPTIRQLNADIEQANGRVISADTSKELGEWEEIRKDLIQERNALLAQQSEGW